MKLVVFSGTTEGRALSLAMAEAGAEVTACVATEYGRTEQGYAPGVRTVTGPLTAAEKAALMQNADLCVDATHPYATHVTATVRAACEAAGVPCYRLLRRQSETDGAVVLETAGEAAAYLAAREGNVLLTCGAKELGAFSALDPARLYPRVLPSHEGLAACEALGVPRSHVIAMQGPFTREMNEATIRQFDIAFLVTKDGGVPGGFPEKREAAKNTGVGLIVLRRPEETGLDYDAVLEICRMALKKAAPVDTDRAAVLR